MASCPPVMLVLENVCCRIRKRTRNFDGNLPANAEVDKEITANERAVLDLSEIRL